MSNLIEQFAINAFEKAGLWIKQTGDTQNGSTRNPVSFGRAKNLYQPKKIEDISLSTQERLKHLYILGATGSGKTKLIEFLIRQDILNNQSLCLIDPHGDLYHNILKFLANLLIKEDFYQWAECFSQKLILIEPSNPKWAVGFNPLETKGINPYSQASEFMGIFKKFWVDAYWGPRMEELLRNTLITLSFNRLTLLEAKALLVDPSFREELMADLPEGEVKDYWINRYSRLSENMKASYREPILNRLSVLITDPNIRAIIGQLEGTINFRGILDQRKWLLVNLSKGQLKGNAYLLGSLIVAKLQLAAFSRVDLPEEKRIPFFLYVDEFQNLIGEDFETIISEARKYGLGLTFAHQNANQISKGLRTAILGNVATQIFFRLSSHDAAILSSELSQKEKPIIQRRLLDFKVGEAYLKKKGERPRMMRTNFVYEAKAMCEAVEAVKTLSLSNCARPRMTVEEEITKRAKILNSKSEINGDINIRKDPYKGKFAPKGRFEEAYEW